MSLQAIHPSTARLIQRLGAMTAAGELDWHETEGGGVQLLVADYVIEIAMEPLGFVIRSKAGKDLEMVNAAQLEAMPGGEFETFADLLKALLAFAMRQARNVEPVVQDMLHELDADEAPPESVDLTEAAGDADDFIEGEDSELSIDVQPDEDIDRPEPTKAPSVQIEQEPDESDEHELPNVSGVFADLGSKALEAEAAEPYPDVDESSLDFEEIEDFGDVGSVAEEILPEPEPASASPGDDVVDAPVLGKTPEDVSEGVDEIPEFLRRRAAQSYGLSSRGAKRSVSSPERVSEEPAGAAQTQSPVAASPSASASDASDAHLTLEEMALIQIAPVREPETPPAASAGAILTESPDKVECSIFAPRAVAQTKLVQIQVFLHTMAEDQRQAAELTAEKIDALSSLRSRKALALALQRGAQLHLSLTTDETSTKESFQLDTLAPEQATWNGVPNSVSFFCRVRDTAKLGDHLLKCLVSVEGVPVGELNFTLEIVQSPDQLSPDGLDLAEPEPEKYESVFLSYAREDKDEVDRVARVYNTLGLTVYRDVSSLQPGERYQDRLIDMLRSADAFILIWSRNAQNSDAVRQEVTEALRAEEVQGRPRFVPFPIEGPPIPMPWREFANRHIGDPIYHKG